MGLTTTVPSPLHPHGTPRPAGPMKSAPEAAGPPTCSSSIATPRPALGELSNNGQDSTAAREPSPQKKTPRTGTKAEQSVATCISKAGAGSPTTGAPCHEPNSSADDNVTQDVQDLLAMADFSPELCTVRRESGKGMALLTPRAQDRPLPAVQLLDDLECLRDMSPEALPSAPRMAQGASPAALQASLGNLPARAEAAISEGAQVAARNRRSLTKLDGACLATKPSTPAAARTLTTPQSSGSQRQTPRWSGSAAMRTTPAASHSSARKGVPPLPLQKAGLSDSKSAQDSGKKSVLKVPKLALASLISPVAKEKEEDAGRSGSISADAGGDGSVCSPSLLAAKRATATPESTKKAIPDSKLPRYTPRPRSGSSPAPGTPVEAITVGHALASAPSASKLPSNASPAPALTPLSSQSQIPRLSLSCLPIGVGAAAPSEATGNRSASTTSAAAKAAASATPESRIPKPASRLPASGGMAKEKESLNVLTPPCVQSPGFKASISIRPSELRGKRKASPVAAHVPTSLAPKSNEEMPNDIKRDEHLDSVASVVASGVGNEAECDKGVDNSEAGGASVGRAPAVSPRAKFATPRVHLEDAKATTFLVHHLEDRMMSPRLDRSRCLLAARSSDVRASVAPRNPDILEGPIHWEQDVGMGQDPEELKHQDQDENLAAMNAQTSDLSFSQHRDGAQSPATSSSALSSSSDCSSVSSSSAGSPQAQESCSTSASSSDKGDARRRKEQDGSVKELSENMTESARDQADTRAGVASRQTLGAREMADDAVDKVTARDSDACAGVDAELELRYMQHNLSVPCTPGEGDRKVGLKQLQQERDGQLRDKVNKVLSAQHEALSKSTPVGETASSASEPAGLHLMSPSLPETKVPAATALEQVQQHHHQHETDEAGQEGVKKPSCGLELAAGPRVQPWGGSGRLMAALTGLSVLVGIMMSLALRIPQSSPQPHSLLPSAPVSSAGDYLEPARQRRLDTPFLDHHLARTVAGWTHNAVQDEEHEEAQMKVCKT